MDNTSLPMDYDVMDNDPSSAIILKSFRHISDPSKSQAFSFLSRAGHFKAGPQYRNQRTSVPGHELFFCLQGRGYIRQSGRRETVTAGQLAWIDVSHPHAHWADPDDPWEVYWLRAEGSQLSAGHAILSAQGKFCLDPANPEEPSQAFQRIFNLFEQRLQPFDALANAEVARMIAIYVGNILPRTISQEGVKSEITDILEEMRIYYQRPWRIEDIARRCQKSPAQTYRLFQKYIGSSPVAWLRRIRIAQAMEKLVSTTDSVSEIAYQVGYNDPLFFSRDFKKTVGTPPSKYRAQETS